MLKDIFAMIGIVFVSANVAAVFFISIESFIESRRENNRERIDK